MRYRIAALLLATFVLLSGARGLVPGLCQNWGDLLTQASKAEASPACASISKARSCCTPSLPKKQEGDSRENPSNSDRPCPFCKMAKALVEVPEAFCLALTPEEAEDVYPAFRKAHPAIFAETPRTRGPPSPFSLPI